MKHYRNFLLLLVSFLLLACGGASDDNSSVDNDSNSKNTYVGACHTTIESEYDLVENMVILANVEQDVYADILLMFSEDGKKELFDTNVSLGEEGDELSEKNYNNIIVKTGELYLSLLPCMDVTVDYVVNNEPKEKLGERENQKLLSSVFAFFYTFMGGTIDHTREVLLSIGKDDAIMQEDIYNSARFNWPKEDFGNSPQAFYMALQSGEFSDKINALHNNLLNDPDSTYSDKAQDIQALTGDQVLKEGLEGLKKGFDVYVDAGTTLVGGSLPEGDAFSKGYDHAKNAIEVINSTEKDGVSAGIWKYVENTGVQKLEDKVKGYLDSVKDPLGISHDAVIDLSKEIGKSTYSNLSNLYNHELSKESRIKRIKEIKENLNESENNKVINPHSSGKEIVNPDLGLIRIQDQQNEINQVVVVSYPTEDDAILVNIDPDKSKNIITTFYNHDKDYMSSYNEISQESSSIEISEYSVLKESIKDSSIVLRYEILENNDRSIVYRVYADIEKVDSPITVTIDVDNASTSNAVKRVNSTSTIYWDVMVLEKDATIYVSRSDADFRKALHLAGKQIVDEVAETAYSDSQGTSAPTYNYDGIYSGRVTSSCEETVTATITVSGSNISGYTSDGYSINGYTISGSRVAGTSDDGITWSGNLYGIPKADDAYNSANSSGARMSGQWTDGACSGSFTLYQQS